MEQLLKISIGLGLLYYKPTRNIIKKVFYNPTIYILNKVFVQPVKEVINFIKTPVRILWGFFVIGTTIFLCVGIPANIYYTQIR